MFDLSALWEGFLDLLYPEPVGCLICGAPTEQDHLCETCRGNLYKNGPLQCEVCGRTLTQGQRCRVCQGTAWHQLCAGIAILYRYDGTARQAVHLAKFSGSRKAARAIAHKLSEHILGMETLPDAILYVPSHPIRTLLRGYSSMGFIAQCVSRITGIPLEREALRRVRYASPLYRVGYQDRRRLVQGAFSKGKCRRVYERAVLLDDVCTSGATITECLRALDDPKRIQVVIFAGHEDSPLEETTDL